MVVDHVPGKQYPEQYRKDTADFVMASGRAIKQCAVDLGINDKTLSNWVADRKREPGVEGTAGLGPAEPKAGPGLADARRRIKGPGLESDFLRRAAACFAKGPAWAAGTRSCGPGRADAPSR